MKNNKGKESKRQVFESFLDLVLTSLTIFYIVKGVSNNHEKYVEAASRDDANFSYNSENGEFGNKLETKLIRILGDEFDYLIKEDKRKNNDKVLEDILFTRNYKANPGDYHKNEPELVTLARAIYAEARNLHKNKKILLHKGSSFLNRMKERNLSLEDVIFEPNQYSFLTDQNKAYFFNTGKYTNKFIKDKEAWKDCYDVAVELIENGPLYPTTHTWHKYDDNRYRGKPQKKPVWTERFIEIDKIKTPNGTYYFYTEHGI
ncbi:MAG: hypothetical protein QW727_02725 [Candidatus Pacearchaeota archaeon]